MSDEIEKAEIDRAFNEALKTHLYLRDPYCYRVGYLDGAQWQAERAKVLVEALEFYANMVNYNDQQCCGYGHQFSEFCCGQPVTSVFLDGGNRAGQALATYRGEK